MKPSSGKSPERDVDQLHSLVYPVVLLLFRYYFIRGGMVGESKQRT